MPRISLAVAEKLHKVYGEFSHLMYSEAFGILSNRDDAEDSVQEACMNIMRSPQTLMRIEDAETLQPYLRIVARNAAKQVWVKRRYHFREISLESNLDWIDNIPDTDCLPIDKACEKVDAEAFASRLPTRYRDFLVLRYYYEAKTREIAIILGMSESNVRTRLSRAQQYVKAHRNEIWKEEK